MAKVRSARGVEVDFEELAIKQSLADSQANKSSAPTEIDRTDNFIDNKRRRKLKQMQDAVANMAPVKNAESVEEQPAAPTVPKKPKVAPTSEGQDE